MDEPGNYIPILLGVFIAGVASLIVISGAAFCEQSYDYIDITDPAYKKTPIAAPVFKSTTHTSQEQEICEEASALLSETLEFTGYFKLIDREAFLENSESMGIIKENIQFKNWTVIQAEYLITGGVLISGDLLTIELRMFDTVKQDGVEGLEMGYTGQLENNPLRKIIHTYCSRIIFQLFEERGIFNSKIAFENKKDGVQEIFTCDFDGYNPQQITRLGSTAMSPAWSTDGKWIAYSALVEENCNIYIKNLSENRGPVVDKPGTNQNPSWVPNKFELSATLTFSGMSLIYLLTGEGKIIEKLIDTDDPLRVNASPSWSPDGNKFAFVSNLSGGRQIYIKDTNTGDVHRLTFDGKYNESPSWSPKGDKIAYTVRAGGRCDIHVIGVDGAGDTQLTFTGDNESPSWSPDGNLIAFTSTREGTSRIYIMTAFGTDQRRLMTLPGEQSTPRWSSNLKN